MRVALITGIKGQTGSYMAELLLENGYKVIGMHQRTSSAGWGHVSHLIGNENLEMVHGDLTDTARINELVYNYLPSLIFNFGAISNRASCEATPLLAHDVNALGIVRILEAVRLFSPQTKIFQATSSDIFGDVVHDTQDENTICRPNTLYGITKLSAHQSIKLYREAHKLFAVSGILYSHSSPRRGTQFVTGKITKAVANIKKGNQKELRLGNLDARHDFGNAKDVVNVAWKSLQYHRAGDYVIGTGQRHTVREFCETAFSHVGLNYIDYVVVDTPLYKKQQNIYIADISKVKRKLKYVNEHTFASTVKSMVDHDMELR